MDTRNGRIYTKEVIKKMKKEEKDSLVPMRVAPTKKQLNRKPPKVGRNESCPCGSGKKFKHCCLRKKGKR